MASELSCAEHPEASGCVRFLSAAPKKAGAEVVVADIDKEKVEEAIRKFEVKAVAPHALGAVINDDTVPQLKAKVVAGATNNI
jgi:glutamate dehydrogenase/leucine dehydrogenase